MRPLTQSRCVVINAYRSRQALSRRKEVLVQQMIAPSREE
jgi:hypothetical protein